MTVTMPYAQKDELAIIGCCLVGGLETSIEAIEAVPIDAFSRSDVRDAFHVIEMLAVQGREVNEYTFELKWKEIHGRVIPEEVASSPNEIPSAHNLKYYSETVVEAWSKRRVMEACHEVLMKGQNPLVKSDELLTNAEAALSGEEVRAVSVVDGKQASQRMIEDLERRFNLQGALSGISTGFRKLDEKTDGLQFGEQTIIAARPSMGKTAIGLNILEHACLGNGVPTLFVSLEMSVAALMRRLLSSCARMPMGDVRRGSYTQSQFANFSAFSKRVSEAQLWFVDGVSGLGINQICATVRRRVRKNGVKLVIIDYLQKIKPAEKQEKRTYEVGEVSGALKALAVSTSAALLTLAQLNRESEKQDKPRTPRLADLADSGQIERDADTVVLIHRDRNDVTGKTDLIVAKQRDGEIGIAPATFNGQYCRFENPMI